MQISDEARNEFKEITDSIVADDQAYQTSTGEDDYDAKKNYSVIIMPDFLSIDYWHLRIKDVPVLEDFAERHGLHMEEVRKDDDIRVVFKKF